MFKTIIDGVIIGSDQNTGRLQRLEKMVSSDDVEEFIVWVQKTLRATINQLFQLPHPIIQNSFFHWLKEKEEIGGMLRIDINENEIVWYFGKLDFSLDHEDPDNGYFVYDLGGRINFSRGLKHNEEKVIHNGSGH